MDEHDSGMDPLVKRYFKKILASIGVGLFWLMLIFTTGFMGKLAVISNSWRWQNTVFYVALLLSFLLVLRFLMKIWKEYK